MAQSSMLIFMFMLELLIINLIDLYNNSLHQMTDNQASKPSQQSKNSTSKQYENFKQLNAHKSRVFCSLCDSMFNNRQNKPQQICVNSHILCKSCFYSTRKVTCLCPFCRVKMNIKGRCNSNISQFLKAYNQYQEQKKTEEKTIKIRKNSFTQFSIPKYIKYLMAIFFIIMIPSLLDLLKYLTDIIIWVEEKLLNLFLVEAKIVSGNIWSALKDLYYLNFYRNQYTGSFVNTPGLDQNQNNSNSPNVQTALNIQSMCYFFFQKTTNFIQILLSALCVASYWIQYLIIAIAGFHFPFLVPLFIMKVQDLLPRRMLFFRNRIYVYIQLMHPQDPIQFLDQKDIESLTKLQLYGMFLIRSYLRFVLKIYGDIEAEMKRKVQQVQYKKKMRLVRASISSKQSVK